MNQGTLFESAPATTVPSPICFYERPCPKQGRAVLGEPDDRGGCVNRSITCQTCGATGVESRRKDLP